MCKRFPRFFLTIVVVQNVPLRITGSSMATECDVIKRHATLKRFHWKGEVCACATGSCPISAILGPIHRPDVIKRHMTPKGFPWKGGMRACATGSMGFLPIIESFDRI